jgi:hypothetical protein
MRACSTLSAIRVAHRHGIAFGSGLSPSLGHLKLDEQQVDTAPLLACYLDDIEACAPMQPANPQQVCCTGGAPLRAKAGRSLCFLPALGARATLAGGGYRDYVIMLFIGSGLP